MTDKVFYQLFTEALDEADRDMYVSEWSTSSVFAEDSDLMDNASICGNIWDVAHMSIKDLCQTTGLGQVDLSARFCVPYRTVQDWYSRRRSCPEYVKLAMAELLGILDVLRE